MQKLPNTPVNSWFDAFHKLEFILEHSKNKEKKAIHLTMLTPFGISQNEYSSDVNSEIVLDDLFR